MSIRRVDIDLVAAQRMITRSDAQPIASYTDQAMESQSRMTTVDIYRTSRTRTYLVLISVASRWDGEDDIAPTAEIVVGSRRDVLDATVRRHLDLRWGDASESYQRRAQPVYLAAKNGGDT